MVCINTKKTVLHKQQIKVLTVFCLRKEQGRGGGKTSWPWLVPFSSPEVMVKSTKRVTGPKWHLPVLKSEFTSKCVHTINYVNFNCKLKNENETQLIYFKVTGTCYKDNNNNRKKIYFN